MTDQSRCEIIVLLDRSGSMLPIANDVRGGFDRYVADQRAQPGHAVLTLVQFDALAAVSLIETVHEALPLAKVPPLDFQPRGGTPLLDAMGQTITRVGDRLAAMPEHQRPGRVLFVVITDGEENSSLTYTKPQIKALVERQTRDYAWQFTYLGANVDAFHEASALGITAAASANYTATGAGTRAVFDNLNYNTRAYRAGSGYEIDDDQRLAMSNPAPTTTAPPPPPTTTPATTGPTP